MEKILGIFLILMLLFCAVAGGYFMWWKPMTAAQETQVIDLMAAPQSLILPADQFHASSFESISLGELLKKAKQERFGQPVVEYKYSDKKFEIEYWLPRRDRSYDYAEVIYPQKWPSLFKVGDMKVKNGALIAYSVMNTDEIVAGAMLILIFLAAAGIVVKYIVLDDSSNYGD